MYSVQKDYADASPVAILYNDHDSLKTASEYIRDHPVFFDDITSDNFMGQVKIIYDNGMVVCVNRHPYNEWTVCVGEPGGWFNYHTTDSLNTGIRSNTIFTLPAKNGWVVYKPLWWSFL